jgi:uncharacterized protein (TIGR02452 family)
MNISRTTAAELGRATAQIVEVGAYRAPSGASVDVREAVRRAVEGTRSYPPGADVPELAPARRATRVEVRNESTLAAARRLVESGRRPVALNFASAKNPGGGFLSGARAQEESLARSSALVACLEGNPMYEFHRARHDAMYTSYAIYSPDVPVFRDDEGALLEAPYAIAFITSPAANAKVVLERDRSRREEIREAMRERVDKILSIAAHHGHDALVLGAWGCGVFGNDSREIAGLFRDALAGRFRGVFADVVFAVLDWSDERRFIGPFEEIFGRSNVDLGIATSERREWDKA